MFDNTIEKIKTLFTGKRKSERDLEKEKDKIALTETYLKEKEELTNIEKNILKIQQDKIKLEEELVKLHIELEDKRKIVESFEEKLDK